MHFSDANVMTLQDNSSVTPMRHPTPAPCTGAVCAAQRCYSHGIAQSQNDAPCAQAHLSAAAPCTRPPPVAQALLALPIVMTLRNLYSGSPATKPISQLLYPTSIPRLSRRCWALPSIAIVIMPSNYHTVTPAPTLIHFCTPACCAGAAGAAQHRHCHGVLQQDQGAAGQPGRLHQPAGVWGKV